MTHTEERGTLGTVEEISSLFPSSYEESRHRFLNSIDLVRCYWPSAELHRHALDAYPDLTIDWITADGSAGSQKLLIFTTGEHGIEGYVGSAMLAYFYEHFLTRLEPDTTGLLIVHALDPWGMKYNRRTNPENLDLNRNFVWELEDLDPDFNPEYARMADFFTPQRSIENFYGEFVKFVLGYCYQVLRMGHQKFWHATHLGQFRFPKGLHYGGKQIHEEVRLLKRLYRDAFRRADHVLHLDMHTGYGPRYQMTLVNSALEPQPSVEFVKRFDYPLVAATNPEEFYAMRGDMIDYEYKLWLEEFPHKRFYATSFEFGTYGESLLANLHCLRSMIFENQIYWFGVKNDRIKHRVLEDFRELFWPEEDAWRMKALQDADQAFRGILSAEGFLKA